MTNMCPECGRAFQTGWTGIDAHWKANHDHIMAYVDAWPLIEAGEYRSQRTPKYAKTRLPLPKVGFIGVGLISEALITGMCGFGEKRAEFLLSPRNAESAARLAERFSSVAIAESNQAVVDGSEIVFVAVRPQVAEEVLSGLKFRTDQRVVSLVAAFPVERLRELVAPATDVSRAVPLPPVAMRRGALTLYTHSEEVAKLLEGLGQLIRVEQESDLNLTAAVSSLMGTYFGLMEAVEGWMIRHGMQQAEARAYVAELFFNLGRTGKERSESYGHLIVDHSTPGGLNEQAWRELKAVGWGEDVQAALELVLDRIHGRATLATQLTKARA